MTQSYSLPHRTGCKTAPPLSPLPARPCPTLTLQELATRLQRLENLLTNAPRLHRKDVALRYGVSLPTLHRWLRAGRLPAPIRLSVPLWKVVDLEAAEQAGQLPRPVSA